jgi:hypothetical protein
LCTPLLLDTECRTWFEDLLNLPSMLKLAVPHVKGDAALGYNVMIPSTNLAGPPPKTKNQQVPETKTEKHSRVFRDHRNVPYVMYVDDMRYVVRFLNFCLQVVWWRVITVTISCSTWKGGCVAAGWFTVLGLGGYAVVWSIGAKAAC